MANTYTLISSNTVGAGGAASITFSSIPSTYTDLLVKFSARFERSAVDTTIMVKFNGSSASFTNKTLYGTGTAAGSASPTDWIGWANGNTSTSNTFGNGELYVPNYAGSTNKSYSADLVQEANTTGANSSLAAGLWSNTAAITSITLYDSATNTNFLQYSTAYLYGIKNS